MKNLEHILIVDDEEDIITIAQLSLQDLGGYKVSTACNGQDFLNKVESLNPDLILLDVMMPELDGPSALKQYREKLQEQAKPVIFMTAKTQRHEIDSFFSLGAIEVLSKPFDPMTLSGEIEQAWAKLHGE